MTHISHITCNSVFGLTPSRSSLSLYLSNISYVDTLVCSYQRISRVQARIIPEDAVFLYLDRTLEAKAPSRPFPQGSPSASSKTRLDFLGPRAASLSPSLPRSISTFPVSATPPGVRLLRPLSLVFASKGIPRFCIPS